MTKKFTKEFLIDKLDLPYNKEIVVEDTIEKTTRWSVIHNIIFKHEDKVYRTWYSEGATEQQDEGPWKYENEIECTEVVEVEVLTKVWKPVGEV